MQKVDITLPSSAYTILIGDGALDAAAQQFRALCPGKRAFIVTDANVWTLHGPRLAALLRALGVEAAREVLPPGEETKSIETLTRLYGAFHAAGLQRRDPVIAFGGGVVGDAAGFAAATYMRGVPFVQMPTTLLAQVDASVGGKVAVNLPQGKNLAGCFYQPSLVVADTGLLATLPPRELRAGLSEVMKYAAIGSDALLALLEAGRTDSLSEIVELSCRCKAGFIAKDERDTAMRRMLNFGHTFGHAIEKYHAYAKYNHGEAVAMGMGLALRTGVLLGITPNADAKRLTAVMERLGLEAGLQDPVAEILPLMAGDKKNEGDAVNLVLLAGLGRPVLHPANPQALMDLLAPEKEAL